MESLPAKCSIAAVGGMGAAIFCHPLDVIRVEMQVTGQKRSTVATAVDIYGRSGVSRGLYSGLSAAFLRQWTYTAGRVGIYSYLLNLEECPQRVPFRRKVGYGMASGGLGSFAAVPAELALVRLSADARKPLTDRRGSGVVGILRAAVREEGVLSMWKGVGPTVVRAMVLSSVALSVTSECKVLLPTLLPPLAELPGANLAAATVIGSFCAVTASQPLDVVKSRLQNAAVRADGAPQYSGAVDCLAQCVRKEGPLVLMRGFTPSFVKLSPFQMISLTLTERITQLLTGKSAL